MATVELVGQALPPAICFRLCLAALLPALAAGQVFLNEKQASEIVLAGCDSVAREEKSLSPEDRAAVEKSSGVRFFAPRYTFLAGSKEGRPCGYAVIVDEIGKSEPITFMIGVTPEGKVGEVALMVFRESRGAEVRDKRFTRQFKGKRLKDPIRLNQDILSYTGATLSSEAMARGVRKALALVERFYLRKQAAGGPFHVRIACLMGTLARVKLYAPDGRSASLAADAAFTEMRRLENIYTSWRESELTRLNRDAASRPVAVSEDLFDLLTLSLGCWRKYGGAFDVTVGPLAHRFGLLPGSVPHARVDSGAVVLDSRARTARFLEPGIEIDLNGIAKGYAAEKAARVLERLGVERALVDLGGSSMYALGPPPGLDGWPIVAGRRTLCLRPHAALATSSARRVLDPRTGRLLGGARSATVVCASGAEAEAAAKAALLESRAGVSACP